MIKKITLVYFSIVSLVAGISAILLGDGGIGDQQITYAQSTTSTEEYPEGHPLAPPQGFPEGILETPPHTQTHDKPGTPQPPSGSTQIPSGSTQIPSGSTQIPSGSTQIPSGGFPEGTSETPPNSQVPPEAPQPPVHPQVP